MQPALNSTLAILVLSLQAAAQAQLAGPGAHVYAHDDDDFNSLFGLTNGGDLCWIQRFDAVGGADTIRSVSTAFGSPYDPNGCPPNGSLAKICVWEDPDDDGIPDDAVLSSLVVVTVRNAGTSMVNEYAIPPVGVSGVFFVGVVLSLSFGQFAAPLDTSHSAPTLAWLCASSVYGGFNANQLSANSIPPKDLVTSNPGVWVLRAEGGGSAPASSIYCTAKTNSLGCVPAIGSLGSPSASSANGFVVTGTGVRNVKPGILLYTVGGRAATPFQGAYLCLSAPVRRTRSLPSGGQGAPGQACSGGCSIDMNAFAAGALGGHPIAELRTVGTLIDCQWWSRDEGAAFSSGLTDALEYTVGV